MEVDMWNKNSLFLKESIYLSIYCSLYMIFASQLFPVISLDILFFLATSVFYIFLGKFLFNL